MKPGAFIEYLYQAQASPLGLVIHASDVAFVIRKLKETQSTTLDEDFNFNIIPSPTTPGEIWILKAHPEKTPGRGRPPKVDHE